MKKTTIKDLGEGRIGGYGVAFTDPDSKDLQDEYFNSDTNLMGEFFERVPMFYQHGLDRTMGKRIIGAARVASRDDTGVWYEAQLNLRDEYERTILELVKQGKLGYSTGSVSHLVEKAQDGKLITWPVVEVTLTPSPAAGPYLTNVQAVRTAYKSVGLETPNNLGGKMSEKVQQIEEQGGEEVKEEAPTVQAVKGVQSLTEAQVKDIVGSEVKSALAPFLKGQPRGVATKVQVDPSKAAVKAFDMFLHLGRNEMDTATKAALQEGTDSEGGYIVPDQYMAELVKALTEQSIVRQSGARVIGMTNQVMRVPSLTKSSAAVLTAEEAGYDEQEPTFGEIVFTAYKFTKLSKVSEELVADAMFDVWGGVLSPDFIQAFAASENTYFTTGTGSSQPQGVVTGAGTGVTAAAVAAITADEVIDLYHSLGYLYRSNATWMMNDAVLAYVRKLKDSTGQYLWQPGLQAGQPDQLLGRPIITNNSMADTIEASAKTILFGDFAYYWIGQRAGMTVDVNPYLYMANGQVGYFGRMRIDGHVVLAAAFKLLVQASS